MGKEDRMAWAQRQRAIENSLRQQEAAFEKHWEQHRNAPENKWLYDTQEKDLRHARELFSAVRDGSLLDKLEMLANSFPCMGDFSEKARRYFSGIDWDGVKRYTNFSDAILIDLVAGYSENLDDLLFESSDQRLKLQWIDERPVYAPDNKAITLQEYAASLVLRAALDIVQRARERNYDVRLALQFFAARAPEFATAIGFALPVFPDAYYYVKVQLSQSGISLVSNWKDTIDALK